MPSIPDVHQWENLPFPRSLPQFQKLFPDDAACARYLEFAFRFNRRFYPFNGFRSLLGIGANGESPTYDGLYSGKWKHATVSGHG